MTEFQKTKHAICDALSDDCIAHCNLSAGRYCYRVEIIAQCLTAVDVIVPVRCKDCAYCDPETMHCDHPMSTTLPVVRQPDNYCSYGDRRNVT